MLGQQARYRGAAAGRSILQKSFAFEHAALDGLIVRPTFGHIGAVGNWSAGLSRLHSGSPDLPQAARPLLASVRADELIAGWLRDHRRAYSSEHTPLSPPRVGLKLTPGSDKDEKVSGRRDGSRLPPFGSWCP